MSASTFMRSLAGLVAVRLAVVSLAATEVSATAQDVPGPPKLTPADHALLDEIERAGVRYFWEAADAKTGLVKDRSRADQPDGREVASIASTGFGLTSLCIADQRGYLAKDAIRERVRTTLEFLAKRMPEQHGFFHHFVNMRTGDRVWSSEVSSIDTAILLCGVLTCGEHFADSEIKRLSDQVYHRVDWRWMLAGGETLCHGWKPESGYLQARWDTYCELMMLYLLAMGSPTHPVPPSAWEAWRRPRFDYGGHRYVNPHAPLFIHQYSHAWFDFRLKRDAHLDYFENSVVATRAHRQFCLDLRPRFPHFGPDLWGVSASDSSKGYVAWGGPPEQGPLDGTLVPCAAGGSIPFLPEACLGVLRTMRERFGDQVWKRYGFVDAFNPHTGWVAKDVIGIDVGITVLMAENARTALVWRTFGKNESVRRATGLAGFKVITP